MEYHLDREIRFIKEVEHSSLYNWALQEFNKAGKSVSSKLIPWRWRLNFVANELKYVKRIEVANHREKSKDTCSESLQIKLNPDDNEILGMQGATCFSMFGTDRNINDFSLTIYRLDTEQDTQYCRAWGIPSYTAEIDFRDHTTDDVLGFEIGLKPKSFDDLCYFVKHKNEDDILWFSVSNVPGFYSEWSPSISTYEVKVLAEGEEQKIIELGENNEPPRLGHIEEFTLHFARRNVLLQAEQNESQDLANSANIEDAKKKPLTKYEFNVVLLAQLNKLQINTVKLRRLLWGVIILLILLLMK